MCSGMVKFQSENDVILVFLFGQYSWKLLHPTDKYGNPNCPEEAEEYERVSHTVLRLVQLLHLQYVMRLYRYTVGCQ